MPIAPGAPNSSTPTAICSHITNLTRSVWQLNPPRPSKCRPGRMNYGSQLPSLATRAEGIAFHCADGADAAAVAGDLFSLKKRGQNVVEVLQLELRDCLADEAFNSA